MGLIWIKCLCVDCCFILGNSVKFIVLLFISFNPLIANPTKWSNTPEQEPRNCLSVCDHFAVLTFKELNIKKFFYTGIQEIPIKMHLIVLINLSMKFQDN